MKQCHRDPLMTSVMCWITEDYLYVEINPLSHLSLFELIVLYCLSVTSFVNNH